MTVRQFQLLRALFLALVAVPIAADGQQATKVFRVAIVSSTAPTSELTGPEPANPVAKGFVHGMRALGYVEGQNIILERLSAEGKFERFPEIFRNLVSNKVDVIVTTTNSLAQAAKDVTQTVPIVMSSSTNPVTGGLVQSLARPGGNVTGLSLDAGPEIIGKRLQLLKELVPSISRVAVLTYGLDFEEKQSLEVAASKLGLRLLYAWHTPGQYADAFALIGREHPDALLVPPSGPNFANRRLIVDFAATSRLPTMFSYRESVDAGGLIAYGSDLTDLARRAAHYVDRILKGANPADLPVERASKFELGINLKTAKALRLTIPPSLRQQADYIIE
jgi:putative ABC transport system substrate-binding protein